MHSIAKAALFLIAALIILSAPFVLKGDAAEYITQTQSLAFNASLSINEKEIAPYFNSTNPFHYALTGDEPHCLDLKESCLTGSGFGSLYPDKNGNLRIAHSPAYSVVVSPVYKLIHLVDRSGHFEYYTFRLANAFFLFLPIVFCSSPIVFFLVVILSPLFPYASWEHPEIFQWSCITLAFLWIRSEAARLRAISPYMLAIGCIQNFPALPFFLPLFLLSEQRFSLRNIIHFGLAAMLGLVFPLYSYLFFGVFSPIEALGHASTQYASLSKTTALLISPSIGGVWTYPGLFIFAALLIRHVGFLRWCCLALTTLLLIYLMSSMANLNSAMDGSSRYLCWLLAPWFGLILGSDWSGLRRSQLIFASVLTLGIFGYLGGAKFRGWRTIPRLSFDKTLETVSQRTYPVGLCFEDPEVIYEKIIDHELMRPFHFNQVVKQHVQEGEIWVIPRRASGSLMHEISTIPADSQIYSCPRENATLIKNTSGNVDQLLELKFAKHPYWGQYIILFVKNNSSGQVTN